MTFYPSLDDQSSVSPERRHRAEFGSLERKPAVRHLVRRFRVPLATAVVLADAAGFEERGR